MKSFQNYTSSWVTEADCEPNPPSRDAAAALRHCINGARKGAHQESKECQAAIRDAIEAHRNNLGKRLAKKWEDVTLTLFELHAFLKEEMFGIPATFTMALTIQAAWNALHKLGEADDFFESSLFGSG